MRFASQGQGPPFFGRGVFRSPAFVQSLSKCLDLNEFVDCAPKITGRSRRKHPTRDAHSSSRRYRQAKGYKRGIRNHATISGENRLFQAISRQKAIERKSALTVGEVEKRSIRDDFGAESLQSLVFWTKNLETVGRFHWCTQTVL